MAKRYAIWNKTDTIITPAGTIYTAEEWKQKYPVAALDNFTIICSAGEINGGFFGTLGAMVQMYENMGCDFSTCTTDEEKLDAIEAFEDAQNAVVVSNEPTAEERTATALEAIASGQTTENAEALDILLTGEE